MDRLSFVTTLAAASLVVACGDDKPSAKGSRDRVNAVQVREQEAADPAAMCDVFHKDASAPAHVLPDLVSAAPEAAKGVWRWFNVWATWCKPCIEELPRLVKWHQKRGGQGTRVDLILISADESEDVVAKFRAEHTGIPPGLRMADPDDLAGWLEKLGVPGATLPVHLFVDPRGRVRCVRASAIEATDFPAIEALLRG